MGLLIRVRLLCFLLFVTVVFESCSKEDEPQIQPKPQSTSINKIMPLGASRVEGDRPAFESFRYELWKQIVDGNWEFDFIGTMTDGASYPDYMSRTFDLDHEGRGGWTSGEILENINTWLNIVGSPDIVLFSSPGGNDILNGLSSFDQSVSNINRIIDILQGKNPEVVILIEELAPGKTSFMTPKLTADFERMQQEVKTIAANQTTADSQVLTVDMYTDFSDDLLADDVHYNAAGAKFIADRYYTVLQTVLRDQ